jgi:hypothetical protein
VVTVMTDNSPTHHHQPNFSYSTKHAGQIKLLLSELQLLTTYSADGDVVLYVGAAPGQHIPYVIALFPMLTFYLCDPREFAVQPSDRVIVDNDYFDVIRFNDWYQHQRGKLILISDIRRTSRTQHATNAEYDEHIHSDMLLQQEWVMQLQPAYSLLKFKLPLSGDEYSYLDGTVLWPAYARQSSSETRLLVTSNHRSKLYNINHYNEATSAFNTITRSSYHTHELGKLSPYLDHCHDCVMCHIILSDYLRYYKLHWSGELDLPVLFFSMLNSLGRQSDFLLMPSPQTSHTTPDAVIAAHLHNWIG